MKDLIFITAYCPTQKQEEALERCINSIVKLGFHIALISHSHIPIHIQKKCNYYFYDFLNDLSDNYELLGHYTFGFDEKRILSRFFVKDFYGFAIYRMFCMAAQIAINFGYQNIHHIEYDCELLDENLIIENNELLNQYDSIIYTNNGKEDGFLFGSFKSFKVQSLPQKFKNYDRDFIESEMKKLPQTHLEHFTKKLFMETGNVLFKSEPELSKFKRGENFYHRNMHFTLFYNPYDLTLNIFYNSTDSQESEEIMILVNNNQINRFVTKIGFWKILPLGEFDNIYYVRIDNNKKIIYEKYFDTEYREVFKIKSYMIID
jgi:hypothetical protein